MENNDNGEVLMRRRSDGAPASVPAAGRGSAPAGPSEGEQLERRRLALQAVLEHDKAAAEVLLDRLERRSESLREFLLEAGKNLEKVDELKLVIHAEREFLVRIGQLELQCARAAGRCPELRGGEGESSPREVAEVPAAPSVAGGSFRQALPLIAGMIVSALIIGGIMAMIFL
ncbi:MAG: hypothetical protein IJT50_14815 [Lentisphaeria bacterium]|nr:hypothetical protein [Lentisphaeria bacterium]